MQFCKDCGSVLNLFGTADREFCSACVQQHRKTYRSAPLPEPVAQLEDEDLLAETVMRSDGEKLTLISKEGWELWSGPLSGEIPLKSILNRAKKIYAIRLKRQKN